MRGDWRWSQVLDEDWDRILATEIVLAVSVGLATTVLVVTLHVCVFGVMALHDMVWPPPDCVCEEADR